MTNLYSPTMFRDLVRLLTLFVSMTVLGLGCGESSSPSSSNNKSGSSSFTIASLSGDSLYWGEWVSINGDGFGTDSNALKLFLYFTDVKFSLMTPKTIFFQIPPNSETGKLRLYKNDLLADGSLTLHVLPKQINGFSPSVTYFQPTHAKAGDKITIFGSSLPMRSRDYSIKLDGMPLSIDSFTTNKIFSHVPSSAKTGDLAVTLFNRFFSMGTLVIEE